LKFIIIFSVLSASTPGIKLTSFAPVATKLGASFTTFVPKLSMAE